MKFVIDKKLKYNKLIKIYRYNFSNLTDLYNYLKQSPKINDNVFRDLASVNNNYEFGGKPLDVAIEYLRGGYNINFEKFNIAIKHVEKFGYEDLDSRKLEKSLHGGMYLSPLVAAGVPDCMVRYRQDYEPKHITIYFQLGYPAMTSASQVFNRGIATINLIKALESKGYMVDLKVFELSFHSNEYLDITINLKHIDELLNISKCYYPFVSKEFLRRLLFRVLESTPVKTDWSFSYGRSLEGEEIYNFYKLNKKDLIISDPLSMGIKGEDIYEDTRQLFEKLNLTKEFDLTGLRGKVKKKSIY